MFVGPMPGTRNNQQRTPLKMLCAKPLPAFILALALPALMATGCSGVDEPAATAPQAGSAQGVTDAAAGGGDADAGSTEEAAPSGFDISAQPVSTVTIGDFPYLSLPEGYRTSDASTFDLDRAPFWTGESFEWVEGRVHQAAIFTDQDHDFAELELRTYVGEMLDRIGAVLVAEEEEGVSTHLAAQHGLDEAARLKYRAGLGHFYSRPIRTYVVRRAEGDVWIHYSSHERGANWIIARSARYDPTIRLLSGVELKRLIDEDGRAIIHLNFGSGDAVIQSDSIPQLEQVVLLLNRDPGLSLSINGHADSQGSAERNMALSLDRAQAIVDALREHGIEDTRLIAEGFGDTEPVADNATAEGRARNRRVELVRR